MRGCLRSRCPGQSPPESHTWTPPREFIDSQINRITNLSLTTTRLLTTSTSTSIASSVINSTFCPLHLFSEPRWPLPQKRFRQGTEGRGMQSPDCSLHWCFSQFWMLADVPPDCSLSTLFPRACPRASASQPCSLSCISRRSLLPLSQSSGLLGMPRKSQ